MKKTLIMEHSKYRFEYEEGKEYDFRVLRGDEDVTREVKNNVLTDLFFETLNILEKHSKAIKAIFGLPESRTLIYNGVEYYEGDIVPAIHWQGAYSDVVEQMKDVTLSHIGEEFLELKSPDGKTRYIRPNWLIEKDITAAKEQEVER